MRLSREELLKITGRKLPSAQVRWFKNHYGVDIQHDEDGPIITEEAFKALVMKQMGLYTKDQAKPRPQLRLPGKAAA